MTLQDFVSTLERRLSAISSLQQETGISPDLQESRLCDLFQQMLQVADNHLEQTKKERDSTKEAIMSTNLRITKLRRLMGENVSDSGLQTAENNKQALLATLLSAENELALVQKEYDKRLEHVKLLYEELADFADSLTAFVDTDLITYEDIDVSPAAVTALEEEIRRCQNEYDARTRRVYHLGEKISHRRTILQEAAEVDEEIKLMKLISGQLNNEERDVLYRKLVREDRLKQLNFQLKRLDELQNEREFRKQEMVLQLYRLWDRLKVPTEERQEFLKQNAGLRKQDLIAYEQELERLNRLKEERIEDFIKSAREELESLWNKLYFSQDERLAFKEAFDDNYSEALLDIHDKEIARLQLLLEDRRYILEKVERHMKLMEEIREFEETTNDPSRLFSKGRRDPGRLLREEKFRKRIARELPKANKELEGVLKEFEITEGQPFRVNGQPYIEVVRNTEDTRKPRRPVHLPTETSEASASSKNYVKRMLPNIDDDDVCYNKAMTSPRFRSVGNRQGFRTPQPTRTYDTKALLARRRRLRKADPESTNEPSILHQVREHNIRKRKVNQIAPRGNRTAATTRDSSSSTDHTMDDLFSQDENTVPSESSIDKPIEMPPLKRRSTTERPKHSALTSDDEMALSLNIFDDGPELSDLSADEL